MVATLSAAAAIPLVLLALGALSAFVWLWRAPSLALGGLLGSLLLGQSWRLPLAGQGGGLLLSDIVVALVLVVAFFHIPQRIRHRQNLLRPILSANAMVLRMLPFILWSLGTLLVQSQTLGSEALLIAVAYWLRLTTHLLLLPALLVLVGNDFLRQRLRQGLRFTIVALCILGFVQLVMLPRLAILGGGWDPHEGRLFSTWLDPNFFGALLSITLPWLLVDYFTTSSHRPMWWRLGVIFALLGCVLVALACTQSRSALVAGGLALLLASPLWLLNMPRTASRERWLRSAVVMTTTIMLLGLIAWNFGDRLFGLIQYDPTVLLRQEALTASWQLAMQHTVRGVGYNAYQFAAQQEGLIVDFSIHSRAGADNSLLTLWITTGFIGVVLFCWPYLKITTVLLRAWFSSHSLPALAVVTGIVAWFIHAQFVNSLLYAHLIIVMAIMIAIIGSSSEASHHD